MKISKTHQKFSERLNQPDALTNPEKYLGPNWQDVLNFWIYLDTLSKQDRKKIADRYWALDCNVLESAINSANVAADEIISWRFGTEAWWASYVAGGSVLAYTTLELIGSHKLIEQGKTPTFLPLYIKP